MKMFKLIVVALHCCLGSLVASLHRDGSCCAAAWSINCSSNTYLLLLVLFRQCPSCVVVSLLTTTMSSATCASEYCNQGWSEVLTHMSPYGYANFGVAFGLGLSIVGAAWGIWLTGSSCT